MLSFHKSVISFATAEQLPRTRNCAQYRRPGMLNESFAPCKGWAFSYGQLTLRHLDFNSIEVSIIAGNIELAIRLTKYVSGKIDEWNNRCKPQRVPSSVYV